LAHFFANYFFYDKIVPRLTKYLYAFLRQAKHSLAITKSEVTKPAALLLGRHFYGVILSSASFVILSPASFVILSPKGEGSPQRLEILRPSIALRTKP
jgi:hypothetical protein